jgi:hypothetical protein
MSPIKLRKAYSERGADMRRPTFLPANRRLIVKLRLVRLKLNAGGYDSGGAYWGAREYPNKLYWAESLEDFELGVFDRPPIGTIEMTVDAIGRKDAKRLIRQLLPNAKFYN